MRYYSKATDDQSREAIARRVAQVRLSSGLNQTDFAERLGIPRRTYLAWERGENDPSVWLLDAFEREFGVDPFWVLRGPEDTPRSYGDAIDWERLARLLQQTSEIHISLKKAPSLRQLLLHAKGVFRSLPASDSDNIAVLERTLRETFRGKNV